MRKPDIINIPSYDDVASEERNWSGEQVRALMRKGLNDGQIARELDISATTVGKFRHDPNHIEGVQVQKRFNSIIKDIEEMKVQKQ